MLPFHSFSRNALGPWTQSFIHFNHVIKSYDNIIVRKSNEQNSQGVKCDENKSKLKVLEGILFLPIVTTFGKLQKCLKMKIKIVSNSAVLCQLFLKISNIGSQYMSLLSWSIRVYLIPSPYDSVFNLSVLIFVFNKSIVFPVFHIPH